MLCNPLLAVNRPGGLILRISFRKHLARDCCGHLKYTIQLYMLWGSVCRSPAYQAPGTVPALGFSLHQGSGSGHMLQGTSEAMQFVSIKGRSEKLPLIGRAVRNKASVMDGNKHPSRGPGKSHSLLHAASASQLQAASDGGERNAAYSLHVNLGLHRLLLMLLGPSGACRDCAHHVGSRAGPQAIEQVDIWRPPLA